MGLATGPIRSGAILPRQEHRPLRRQLGVRRCQAAPCGSSRQLPGTHSQQRNPRFAPARSPLGNAGRVGSWGDRRRAALSSCPLGSVSSPSTLLTTFSRGLAAESSVVSQRCPCGIALSLSRADANFSLLCTRKAKSLKDKGLAKPLLRDPFEYCCEPRAGSSQILLFCVVSHQNEAT